MSLPSQVLADPDLFKRNIIFVPTASLASSSLSSYAAPSVTSSSTTPLSTAQPSSPSTSSTAANSTIYKLDIPEDTGSNNLKYLYLFFLLLGLIILGIIARVIIVKRRRARELEKRAINRNEALRLDLENRTSNEQTPASAPRTGYTFPLFNMNLFRNPPRSATDRDQLAARDMEESNNPPPPYPTHVKSTYIRDPRLPVYQEASDEEEESIMYEQRSNPSQYELRRPSFGDREEEQSILSLGPRPDTSRNITNHTGLANNSEFLRQNQNQDNGAAGSSASSSNARLNLDRDPTT